MTRLAANREIVARLSEAVERFPDLRFQQVLWLLGLVARERGEVRDAFYDESVATLARLEEASRSLAQGA